MIIIKSTNNEIGKLGNLRVGIGKWFQNIKYNLKVK